MRDFGDEIAILVPCSDKYYSLISGFIHFFEKNMPLSNLSVYFSLERKKFEYNNLNYHFVNSDSPYWSDRVYNTLKLISQNYVVILLDDYWLLESADTDILESFFNFAIDNSVDHLNYLETSVNYFHKLQANESINNITYYFCSKGSLGSAYLIGVGGIYNKDFLKSILRKYESAWDFETEASIRYSKFKVQNNFRLTAPINPFPYPYGGIIHKGRIRNSVEVKSAIDEYGFEWFDQRVNVSTNETHIIIRFIRKIKRIFFRILNFKIGKFHG